MWNLDKFPFSQQGEMPSPSIITPTVQCGLCAVIAIRVSQVELSDPRFKNCLNLCMTNCGGIIWDVASTSLSSPAPSQREADWLHLAVRPGQTYGNYLSLQCSYYGNYHSPCNYIITYSPHCTAWPTLSQAHCTAWPTLSQAHFTAWPTLSQAHCIAWPDLTLTRLGEPCLYIEYFDTN